LLKEIEARVHRLKEETDQKDQHIRDKSKRVGELEQALDSYDDKLKSIEQRLLTLREEKRAEEEKN
jgi:uncharacterized coiled-coil protein SlyX